MRAAVLKRARGRMELYDCAAYSRLALAGETGPKRVPEQRAGGEGGEERRWTAAGQAVRSLTLARCMGLFWSEFD